MSHLTGNTRFRMGWRGKLVLQVEVDHDSFDAPFGCWWRDANLFDLQELGYKLESQIPPGRNPRPEVPPAAPPPPPPTRKVHPTIRPKEPPPAPQMTWTTPKGYVPKKSNYKPRKKRKEQHP